MPIYEYRCTDCDKHVEKMQKVSDEPLTKCESCGGKLEKMISLSGFQFKGAGWYITDYSGKSTPSSDSSSESKTSSTDASGGGTTD
jgi:putative FmdB family regulatory protein